MIAEEFRVSDRESFQITLVTGVGREQGIGFELCRQFANQVMEVNLSGPWRMCQANYVVDKRERMPRVALRSGAKLVIINLMPTPHDHYADIVINEKIGETLSQVVEMVKTKLKGSI